MGTGLSFLLSGVLPGAPAAISLAVDSSAELSKKLQAANLSPRGRQLSCSGLRAYSPYSLFFPACLSLFGRCPPSTNSPPGFLYISQTLFIFTFDQNYLNISLAFVSKGRCQASNTCKQSVRAVWAGVGVGVLSELRMQVQPRGVKRLVFK